MFRTRRETIFILIVSLVVIASSIRAQETEQSEREAMYYHYLEFASYVKDGSIEPHWMADGNSFWYAEGDLLPYFRSSMNLVKSQNYSFA